MSALKGDAAAIWPDKLHAKGLAARCRGTALQVPGHSALTFCHLSCGYSPSASGTLAIDGSREKMLLRAKRWPVVIFLTSRHNHGGSVCF